MFFFDRLLPSSVIDFKVNDDKFSEIKLSNMNGKIRIYNVILNGRNEKLIIDILKANILMNAKYSIGFINKTFDAKATIAFSFDIEFGKRD